MEIVKLLQESFLSQDVAFSITHVSENVRVNARGKAIAGIQELLDAGVTTPIIFHLLSTTFIMMYTVGQLSLLDHKEIIETYLEKIYPDADYRATLTRQLMIQMSIIKQKGNANPGNASILQAVHTAMAERNLNPT
jgi:hypothetical protein